MLKRRDRSRAKVVSIVLSLLFIAAGSAYFSYVVFGRDERQLLRTIDRQVVELTTLREQLKYVEQMKVNAEVGAAVDRQALEQLREELVSWNLEYTRLEDKTNFYRSLMEPKASQRGIYIESVEIHPVDTAGLYSYRVLVAQRSSVHDRVTGTLSLELHSTQNSGDIQVLTTSQFVEEGSEKKLGFKFFQQREGRFRVPSDFEPSSVKVIVETKGKSSMRIDEVIEWNKNKEMRQINSFGG